MNKEDTTRCIQTPMSDQTFESVMMPIIRRVVPNLIAADIVGIAPIIFDRIRGTENIAPLDMRDNNDPIE